MFLLVAGADSAMASSISYKGVGGQIGAYGKVMGTYHIALAFTEICGEDPSSKIEAEATKQNYLEKNNDILEKLSKALDAIAIKNGGEKEKLRLHAEINNSLAMLKSGARSEAKKQVVNSKSCSSILANLRAGVMDIIIQRSSEISIILNGSDEKKSDDMNSSRSFLQGTVEGCIDGQKKIFRQQGIPFKGNEKLVNQYCYCIAPMTAEILSTADKRIKMLNGDPEIKEQLQKIEAICLDGVKNGRHFGP